MYICSDTRIALSQDLHPFYDRPDCSGSDWRTADVVLDSGIDKSIAHVRTLQISQLAQSNIPASE